MCDNLIQSAFIFIWFIRKDTQQIKNTLSHAKNEAIKITERFFVTKVCEKNINNNISIKH